MQHETATFINVKICLKITRHDSINNSLGSYMFAVLIYDGSSTKFIQKVLLFITEAVTCVGNQNLSCEMACWRVYTENVISSVSAHRQLAGLLYASI